MSQDESLSVFVTGCDRGLGRSLAREFARHGHRVYAGVFLPEEQREGPFADPRITPVPLDISSDQSVAEAAGLIARSTASLDILINNAARLGVTAGTIEDRIDFADVLATLNTNAVGALRVTNALVPLLKNGRTKLIVNISSEAGSIGMAQRVGWFGYCMSKAALNMQSVLCFNHLRRYGFRMRVIQPGYMKTYMLGERNEKAELEPDEVARRIYDLIRSPDLGAEQILFTDTAGNPLPW